MEETKQTLAGTLTADRLRPHEPQVQLTSNKLPKKTQLDREGTAITGRRTHTADSLCLHESQVHLVPNRPQEKTTRLGETTDTGKRTHSQLSLPPRAAGPAEFHGTAPQAACPPVARASTQTP